MIECITHIAWFDIRTNLIIHPNRRSHKYEKNKYKFGFDKLCIFPLKYNILLTYAGVF